VLRGSEDTLICDLHNGDVAHQNIPIILLRISPLLGPSEFSKDTSSTFNAITVISPMFVSHFLFKYYVAFLHEVQKKAISAHQVL
jgi:hypothetical protein